MPRREFIVEPSTAMPKGYAFLKKGIKYKTLHCRRLTHEAGKPVYVVEDKKKKVLGIRVPKSILFHVQSLANETLPARRLATEQRDAALIRAAATELDRRFPLIPKDDREAVLKHGFRKYSGRVGRTGQIPIPRKVLYAVIAHIRHKHTRYDEMLNEGMDRDAARKAIQGKVQAMLRKWGATEGED
ncbi:hypothetical protein BU26DRAFT_507903 [Trematosphaeria pertusa]|uniref:DUF2293 domain-containing protein n=1 Tax=Trematosphaeria pertusa TaxID=390896 RepID=A0A6A6I9U4_9PLEO|nr:uncharacterized protein BU26DRAFT_507903 [Trematosphaeria pertusa]KAF2246303.1 hypothetical protein BU26DRAFT_507903 [Trematosphaeria pertusa]